MSRVDPVTLAVFRHRLEAIAEEMGTTLQRTASSPNIKERRDYSCGLFDSAGQLVAQAAHIPVHLGSLPMSVAAALASGPVEAGDVVVLNDPFAGGTHLPDVTMVSPVEVGGRRVGYVASRAHQMDIGGMSPGSMPLAVDCYQEGIAIPPVRLVRAGVWQHDLVEVLARNVRTPDELRSDLAAQVAAQGAGADRLVALVGAAGAELVAGAMAELMDYSERAMRSAVAAIPDGRWEATDVLEGGAGARAGVGDGARAGVGDGARAGVGAGARAGLGAGARAGLGAGRDGLIHLRVAVTVAGSEAVVDFSGSDAQVESSLNAVAAITASAVAYCFTCLLEDDVPANAGCFRPVRVVTEPGSILDARLPAAVSAGNVETSQRVVDVVWRALAPALPELVPAAGQGTMNNVTFGGWDPRRGRPFAYYETLGGGVGASPRGDGLSGVHVAMSNTLNTPIEALEHELPVQVTHYRLRAGSGGKGRYRGGDGIERGYRFLVPVRGTVVSERRQVAPWGLAGGGPGRTGHNRLNGAALGARAELRAEPGDVLSVDTPGGGGWGPPG